jgi:hypothetical protein
MVSLRSRNDRFRRELPDRYRYVGGEMRRPRRESETTVALGLTPLILTARQFPRAELWKACARRVEQSSMDRRIGSTRQRQGKQISRPV